MEKAENLLAEYIEIKSPKVLFEVVESLRDFVKKGLLKETGGTCSLNQVQAGQPFPADLINIEFSTVPGGTKYFLSCETYHGAGGVFKRI